MLGWNDTRSRDYAEAVVNGRVDEDLENMQTTIEHRRAVLRGAKYCPDCGELLGIGQWHTHDGLRYINVGSGEETRPLSDAEREEFREASATG